MDGKQSQLGRKVSVSGNSSLDGEKSVEIGLEASPKAAESEAEVILYEGISPLSCMRRAHACAHTSVHMSPTVQY